MNVDRNYLLSNEVAQMLDVSPATVRSWIAKGWLKATKLSKFTRNYRIDRADLNEFLEDVM
jgi:excisionase family DNA binding protein